jgi:hypothetical protein
VSNERRTPRKKAPARNPDLAVLIIYHFTAESNRRRGTSGEMVLNLAGSCQSRQETGDGGQETDENQLVFFRFSSAATSPLTDLTPVL